MLIINVLVVAATQISVPFNPEYGMAMDNAGNVYGLKVGELKNSSRALRVARYSVKSGKAIEEFLFPYEFKGQTEILPVKDGIVFVDYEGSTLVKCSPKGKELWKVRTRFPGFASLDSHENVWLIYGSGDVRIKTPDSSEVEPVLLSNGSEASFEHLVDVAGMPNGDFYLVDRDGDFFFCSKGVIKLIVNIEAQRLLPSGPNGAVIFSGDSISIYRSGSTIRKIWTAPAGSKISAMGRSQDGRLLVGETKGNAGVIHVLDREIEK